MTIFLKKKKVTGTTIVPNPTDTAHVYIGADTDEDNTLKGKLSDGTVFPIYTGRPGTNQHGDPWFDVTAFGTVDKTGAADSTAAFTACVTAVKNSPRGGVMFIPAGVYLVNTATIDFSASSNPISVQGPDRGVAVILPNGTGDVIKLSNTADGASIKHLSIFSSGATQTAGNAINTNGCDDVQIEDVLFNNQFVDVNINNSSLKVSCQKCVSTHGVNNGANSVGVVVNNGPGGDTYIGPDWVMSDSGATRRRACVEVIASGHFEINQCNMTGSAQGLLVDPGAGQIVSFGFINESLFDSCTVNGMTLSASTATSTIKSIKSTNSWYSGTITGAGLAGVVTSGVAGGIIDGITHNGDRFLNNQTHGYQLGFGTGFRFDVCEFRGNSAAGANTSDGLNIAAGVTDFTVIGGKSGGTDAAQTGGNQRWGIFIAAGASDRFHISGVDVRGNTTGPISDGSSGAVKFIGNNIGDLVKGQLASATATFVETTTLTLIPGAIASIAANALKVGTSLRVRAQGVSSATTAGTNTIVVKIGTLGTTADASMVQLAPTTGTTAAGWTMEFILTLRSIGASAGVYGNGFGIVGVTPIVSNTAAAVTINSTVANFITVSAQLAGGVSPAGSVYNCTIEVM